MCDKCHRSIHRSHTTNGQERCQENMSTKPRSTCSVACLLQVGIYRITVDLMVERQILSLVSRGHRGCMVVGLTTTCTISGYHH